MENDLYFAYDNIASMLLSKDKANGTIACQLIKSQKLNDGHKIIQAMGKYISNMFVEKVIKHEDFDDLECYAQDETSFTLHQCEMMQIEIEKSDGYYTPEVIDFVQVVTSCDANISVFLKGFTLYLNCEISYDPKKNTYDVSLYSWNNKLVINHDDIEVHYLSKKMYSVFIKKLLAAYDVR